MKNRLTILLTIICFLFFSANAIYANTTQDTNISVIVPPRLSDFQFGLTSDGSSPIPQNTTITYTLNYGALQSAATTTTTTIVVNYSDDKAPNNADILDYVFGSATNAYNNTQPVVDLNNRTITWTIPNLPAGTTDQEVTFQLKTNNNYIQKNSFAFQVRAEMSNQYVTLPDQVLNQTYQYQIPKPGPTPTPTIGQAPSPTLSPTPTPASYAYIYNVSQTNISSTQASIQINTKNPAKLTVVYGTSPNALNQKVTTSRFGYINTVNLKSLQPDSTYYFRIITENELGQTFSSEIFTVKTAKRSVTPNVENNIIVFSSDGNVFYSDSQEESDLKNPSIILTNNTDDAIAYTLTDPIAVKTIDVIVINKVLAATTVSSTNEPSEFVFPMQEKTPTLYVANLTTIPQGLYEVDVQITDNNGNIIQKQINDLKIMPPLVIYGQSTHTPLADARIYISYYDDQTKKYQPVTSALFGNIKNPSYTDSLGEFAITLPTGTYRIEASSLFYDSETRDFTIGPGINQNFPVIYLKRDPFNLVSLFTFTKEYFGDSWTKMLAIIFETSSSVRIFHLVDLGILGTFVCLTFFFFLFRSHLSLRHLPVFVLFHLDRVLKKHQQQYIFGQIVDEQNNPISRVRIEIEDAKTNNILLDGSSHKTGKFYFTNIYKTPINIILIKESYEPAHITIDAQTDISEAGLQIKMVKGIIHHETVISSFIIGLEEGFGLLFETFLVSSFLLEIFFSIFLSHQKTLPFFFFLSFGNIILWIFYLREQRHLKS